MCPTVVETTEDACVAAGGGPVFVAGQDARRSPASAVCALFDAVAERGPVRLADRLSSYGERERLCRHAPGYGLPAGACGTGFLVAPDLVATAAHRFVSHDAADCWFVFAFALRDRAGSRLAPGPVRRGLRIEAQRYGRDLDDWALVRLARPVSLEPVRLRGSGLVIPGEPVYTLGHPGGLPLVRQVGRVTDAAPPAHFVADLPAAAGASGSPVLSARTHETIGMLVRGDRGHVWRRCGEGSCRTWTPHDLRDPAHGSRVGGLLSALNEAGIAQANPATTGDTDY